MLKSLVLSLCSTCSEFSPAACFLSLETNSDMFLLNPQCVCVLNHVKEQLCVSESPALRFSALWTWTGLTTKRTKTCVSQAGMIRTSQDEFFIEPLDRRRTGEEEEEEGGRQHIIYRSSAVIKKQPAVNQTEAVNQSADDFLRGETNTDTRRETKRFKQDQKSVHRFVTLDCLKLCSQPSSVPGGLITGRHPDTETFVHQNKDHSGLD